MILDFKALTTLCVFFQEENVVSLRLHQKATSFISVEILIRVRAFKNLSQEVDKYGLTEAV